VRKPVESLIFRELTDKDVPKQGCQMVYFQTKNLNLGKLFEGFKFENIFWPFVIIL
jgi:hypothetical protein